MSFNTVKEIIQWRSFTYEDSIYDLSHLNAHHAEYVSYRNPEKPVTYRFIVTYGFHCFTEDTKYFSDAEATRLMYCAPKESRPFSFDRYTLSKHLPLLMLSLGKPGVLVCHAGYGKYATVKLLDSNGVEVSYFVPFVVFRESRKLRLHVQSAYSCQNLGRVQKVNFFTIAERLLRNQKLPRPR